MRKTNTFPSPVIQPLESRRLMSLTAGFDIAPAAAPHAAALIHIDRPLGFGHQSGTAESVSNFPPPPPPDPATGPLRIASDSESLDAQFAAPIALGAPIVLSPTAVSATQNAAADDNNLTSISALYSTIGTSTVSAIDDASTLHTNTLDDLFSTQASTDSQKDFPTQTVETSNATTAENGAAGILLASIAAHAPADSTAAFDIGLMDDHSSKITQTRSPDDAPPAEASSLISRSMLQSLEQELHAVQAYSRELAWNMGRDRAIELAHAQVLPDAGQPASSDWNTTASVITAAIASIVYAERELVRGKKNLGSIFSIRPLHQHAE